MLGLVANEYHTDYQKVGGTAQARSKLESDYKHDQHDEEIPIIPDLKESFLHLNTVAQAFKAGKVVNGRYMTSKEDLIDGFCARLFLPSVTGRKDSTGKADFRTPADSFTADDLQKLIRNMVWSINKVYTSNSDYPNIPRGWSPFILYSPLAGNLLWAANTLNSTRVKTAWKALDQGNSLNSKEAAINAALALIDDLCQKFQWLVQEMDSRNRHNVILATDIA